MIIFEKVNVFDTYFTDFIITLSNPNRFQRFWVRSEGKK